MQEYNKTQLYPEKTFERHIYHRDQFAHFLRWTHVLKLAGRHMNVLDLGCGTGDLLEVLYRNRLRPLMYLGIDIRDQTIHNNKVKWSGVPFECKFLHDDLTSNKRYKPNSGTWDIITSFEVIEHMPREKQPLLLKTIKTNMTSYSTALISTPNYSEKQGAAKNHVVNGEICERTYGEMLKLIDDAGFKLVSAYGTFANIDAIEEHLSGGYKLAFMKLREYHDVNILSTMFAPLIPEHSRNVMYVLNKGDDNE